VLHFNTKPLTAVNVNLISASNFKQSIYDSHYLIKNQHYILSVVSLANFFLQFIKTRQYPNNWTKKWRRTIYPTRRPFCHQMNHYRSLLITIE